MSAPRLRTVQVGMGWQGDEAGGLNRFFVELLQHLPDAGVDAVGLIAGTGLAEQQTGGRIRAFASATAPIWQRLSGVREATASASAGDQPTVLVSHFAAYGMGLLDEATRRPFVNYFHGPWAEESRIEGSNRISAFVRSGVEKRVYSRADACIALSRAFADILAKDYGVPRDRIHVIPGGVEASRFDGLPSRAEARSALGWDATAPTVLAVRRLVKRTGVDRLVRAAALLREKVPMARVMIVGEGSERAALEKLIATLKLGDTVQCTGFLAEEKLPLAYRAADVSVVPSIALEGFGLIVAESLAAGTPVLVTPVGGLPEVVEALSPALVLADSTPDAIADGLIGALTGARALPDAATCARFAREHYDWPVIARQVAALLQRVHAEWKQ